MTAYATRSPLQLLGTNTHHLMAEQRQSGRRTSARLREKEDAPPTNGATHGQEKAKPSTRLVKTTANGLTADSRTRAKRKLEYDEEDDGFMFNRVKSKRAKGKSSRQSPEPTQQTRQVLLQPSTIEVSKKARASGAPAVDNSEGIAPRRRSTRNSGNRSMVEPSELQLPKKRTKRKSPEDAPNAHDTAHEREETISSQRRVPTLERSNTPAQEQTSSDTTKIALPFADTPVIRRNKEMRKGSNESRRSSLSNRGRRASSLIESGTSNALPHDQVEAADFYKHIESGLLEPRRMRQLLIWCGTRALSEKPSFATEDGPARSAAREIQQQLLKDFSSKSELSDWLSREQEEPPSQPEVLRPNPKNIANLAKIEELEQKFQQLQEERKTWERLLRPPTEPLFPPLPDTIPSISSIPTDNPTSAAIASLTSQPNPSANELTSTTRDRITTATETIQDEVDKLVDSVNRLGQHLTSAEDLGRKCLSSAARTLEERDRQAADQEGVIGVRDVLRGLSRVAGR